jgi:hypothetical protein
MATNNAAILGEEMERCMRELNTLRAEGLEAELLGPRFETRRRGKRHMPPRMKVTGYGKGKPDPDEVDVDDEDTSSWSEANNRPAKPAAKPPGNNASGGRPPTRNAPGGFRRNGPEDTSSTYGRNVSRWPNMKEVSQAQRNAIDKLDEEDEEDEGDEKDEDTMESDTPSRNSNIWDMVAKFFDVETIQSPEHVRELVVGAMSSGGSLMGKIDPEVLRIFNELTRRVLEEALPVVGDLAREPTEGDMRRYGFAMIIVNEYLKLAGLHAHVRSDMETFVDFYDRTSLVDSDAAAGEKYLRFSECCESVAGDDEETHVMSFKMTLRSMSVGIARKMMLMATHLVELIVVLGWYHGGGT